MSLRTEEKLSLAGILLILCIGVAAVCGWVSNIYKFAQCDLKSPVKAEIVRGIGIPFAPVGAVLGYLDIKDTPEVNKKPR